MTDYTGRHASADDDGAVGRDDADVSAEAALPGDSRGDALGVETVIVPERGQWAVDIVVVFADGVVRRRVNTYRTEQLARISASYIKRGAERDIGGPVNG